MNEQGQEATTPRYPENARYGCVDCGSINHTTSDVTWCRIAQGRIRSKAVEIVDARHRYTYEFSSSPEAHLQEYDDEEARLLAEAKEARR